MQILFLSRISWGWTARHMSTQQTVCLQLAPQTMMTMMMVAHPSPGSQKVRTFSVPIQYAVEILIAASFRAKPCATHPLLPSTVFPVCADESGTPHRTAQQGDLSSWFKPPRAAAHPQLSSFGSLYLLLESWVSPATRAFVKNSAAVVPPAHSNAESAARRRALLTQISAGIAAVLQSLRTGVPRSHVESHLQGLLATLNLTAPVPHLKVCTLTRHLQITQPTFMILLMS